MTRLVALSPAAWWQRLVWEQLPLPTSSLDHPAIAYKPRSPWPFPIPLDIDMQEAFPQFWHI